MWVVLRLVVSLVVALSRLMFRLNTKAAAVAGHLHGHPYALTTEVNSKGEQVSFQIGAPLPCSPWFELKDESCFDRLCKKLGLVSETQTGDADFDRRVYLGLDNPALQQHLQQNAASRTLILHLLLTLEFERIWSDGHTLWAEKSTDQEPQPAEFEAIIQLAAALGSVATLPHSKTPRFFWHYLAVESLTYSLFGYAAVVLLEQRLVQPSLHLEPYDVFRSGLVAALLLFGLLVALSWLILRGSSRSHFVLAETALLLLVALPVCGTDLVSQLNRAFDQAEPMLYQSRISDTEIRERQSGSGRYSIVGLLFQPSTSYHLELWKAPVAFGLAASDQIEVSESLFRQAAKGSTVELKIKPGWLGLPWYQQVAIISPAQPSQGQPKHGR